MTSTRSTSRRVPTARGERRCGAQRGSAPDLYGRQCIGRFNDEVHFHASRRPPRPQPSIARCVAPRGQVLIDQSLAGRADGIGHGARCVVRAECHGDAGVGEVELRLRRQCATRRPRGEHRKTCDKKHRLQQIDPMAPYSYSGRRYRLYQAIIDAIGVQFQNIRRTLHGKHRPGHNCIREIVVKQRRGVRRVPSWGAIRPASARPRPQARRCH